VTIEDMVAEDDKVVVRNVWRGTERDAKVRLEFCRNRDLEHCPSSTRGALGVFAGSEGCLTCGESRGLLRNPKR
jgi:hypothetical protein